MQHRLQNLAASARRLGAAGLPRPASAGRAPQPGCLAISGLQLDRRRNCHSPTRPARSSAASGSRPQSPGCPLAPHWRPAPPRPHRRFWRKARRGLNCRKGTISDRGSGSPPGPPIVPFPQPAARAAAMDEIRQSLQIGLGQRHEPVALIAQKVLAELACPSTARRDLTARSGAASASALQTAPPQRTNMLAVAALRTRACSGVRLQRFPALPQGLDLCQTTPCWIGHFGRKGTQLRREIGAPAPRGCRGCCRHLQGCRKPPPPGSARARPVPAPRSYWQMSAASRSCNRGNRRHMFARASASSAAS